MVVQTFENGLRLHHITPADVRDMTPRFAEAYCRIFATEPYNESFSIEEAERVFTSHTRASGNITLVITDDERVVAFGIAIPLAADGKVSKILSGLLPMKHTMYLVELGVSPEYRGKGLGRRLVKERVKRIDSDAYSHVVLRVAENRRATVAMYENLDFSDMGVSMNVSRRRTDGEVRSDRRHFMARVLSQVRVDD